jgi:hypothetical protein
MMDDKPGINDLLEAYRPKVDNLADDAWQSLRAPLASDPQVQRRAESIQHRDRVVHTAMHDVPIPAGLAERLLVSLPESEPADFLSTAPASASEAVNLPLRPAASTRFGRRAWAAAVVGAAAIVALAIGFWRNGPTDSGPVSAEDLAGMVTAWENDPTLASGGTWKKLSGQSLPSYPIEPSDLQVTATRAIGPVQRDGLLLVVYDLAAPGGKTARLYVARTNRTFDVPTTPQSFLRSLTGSLRGIAWQRDQHLYVVVVDSPDSDLREFVRLREIT